MARFHFYKKNMKVLLRYGNLSVSLISLLKKKFDSILDGTKLILEEYNLLWYVLLISNRIDSTWR